jgi:hypothetical protein
MSRHLFRIIALVLAIGLQSQVARAQDNTWNWLFGRQDPRLTVTGIAVGLGADAGYLALRHRVWYNGQNIRPITPLGAFTLTTGGCMALYPIIGTIWLNRPLSTREAWTGMADCIVPFIGGWIVEASFRGQPWYEAGPMAAGYTAPAVIHHRMHHRHK